MSSMSMSAYTDKLPPQSKITASTLLGSMRGPGIVAVIVIVTVAVIVDREPTPGCRASAADRRRLEVAAR